jgi:putative protease
MMSELNPAWNNGEAVQDAFVIRIEQRNKFSVGDTIEIMKPDGTNTEVVVKAMYNENWESVDSCPHPKQVLWIELSGKAQKYDLLRVKNG